MRIKKGPSPWLLVGALIGPAAIATAMGGVTPHFLILPIVVGIICGSNLFVVNRGQHNSGLVFFSVAFGGICAIVSTCFLFGACSTASQEPYDPKWFQPTEIGNYPGRGE